MREFWKFATLAHGAAGGQVSSEVPRRLSHFSGVWGKVGRGVRGDSGGRGSFQALKSKWNCCTNENLICNALHPVLGGEVIPLPEVDEAVISTRE